MGPPGHLGLGLAAKPVAPLAPLWVLLLATEVPDLLFFGFEAAGFEHQSVTHTDLNQGVQMLSPGVMPWSHGLHMTLTWSLLVAVMASLLFRNRRTGITLGLLVFSHWILDFVVHPPELPLLFSDSPLVGLGLWGSGPGLMFSGILELSLLAGGIVIYLVNRKRTAVQAAY